MKPRSGKNALELMEEAAHLLRLAPAGTLACYGLGTLPFALGFLFFWGDMSRSAFAFERVGLSALGMAVLYAWMKCWQAVFLQRLKAQLRGEPAPVWTWDRLARLVCAQMAIQPTGLIAVPVATVSVLPLGWVLAFYHGVSVEGDGRRGVGETIQRSLRQAALWPAQNHAGLLTIWLFWIYLWANVVMALMIGPWFLQTFLGMKTFFLMSLYHMGNSTYLAATVMLTYVCLNPLVKTVYLLRCFYGESQHTGEDLKADLRRAIRARGWMTAMLIGWLLMAGPLVVSATDSTPASPEQRVAVAGGGRVFQADDLDRSIERTLQRREYTWRLPREGGPKADADKNLIEQALDEMVAQIARVKTFIHESVRKLVKWLRGLFKPKLPPMDLSSGNAQPWAVVMRVLTTLLLAVLAGVLVWTLWRAWKRRTPPVEVIGEAVISLPDVADENVLADQLPSESWLRQARELMERGELRLAVRALYLSSLSLLAQRELIRIARFKSNREYERELKRRARDRSDLHGAFGSSISIFENVWYGMHEVTADAIEQFNLNLERIRTDASR